MHGTENKILSETALLRKLAEWRLRNHRIVFTNGCFDLLHLGHVDYLEKARQFGDRMLVGLNTDASVQRLKGETRPLQDEMSRARVMASLQFVDAVVFFDEDTPLKLIETVMPDVLVKGADYEIEQIVGAKEVLANGGKVERIEFVDGYSTSKIVDKILNHNLGA
ncbi:MAG: D-glycero-beta-D-manno-heptose 1-phosphate adenylyltransferase [Bacteroidota bacterium]